MTFFLHLFCEQTGVCLALCLRQSRLGTRGPDVWGEEEKEGKHIGERKHGRRKKIRTVDTRSTNKSRVGGGKVCIWKYVFFTYFLEVCVCVFVCARKNKMVP